MRNRLYEAMETGRSDPNKSPKTRFLTQQSNVLLLGILALVLMIYGWTAHSAVPADPATPIAGASKAVESAQKTLNEAPSAAAAKKPEAKKADPVQEASRVAFALARDAQAQAKALLQQKKLFDQEKKDSQRAEKLLNRMQDELKKEDGAFLQADSAMHSNNKKGMDKAIRDEQKQEKGFEHDKRDLDKAIASLKKDLAEMEKTKKGHQLDANMQGVQDNMRKQLAIFEGKKKAFEMHEKSSHAHAAKEHELQGLEGKRGKLLKEEHKHHDKVRKFRDAAQKSLHAAGDILKREEEELAKLHKLEAANDKKGAQKEMKTEQKHEKEAAKALAGVTANMAKARQEEKAADGVADRMRKELQAIGGQDHAEATMGHDLTTSLTGLNTQLSKLQGEAKQDHASHDSVRKWLRR
eukprot:TRINITY_DN27253_c0_g1_i1.p1 TRINITY_DN27253_c0_g1~~TRINITY_DN27253_c0_g1_i1.p1  ORF type:complete len:410 (+),score=172.16 TRINITY_DN27253_c0_g1_i1:70-1299(+)